MNGKKEKPIKKEEPARCVADVIKRIFAIRKNSKPKKINN